MSLALSIGLSVFSRLALAATMLSTICLLQAALLFILVATLLAVRPLLVRISRIRTEEAKAAAPESYFS